MDRLSSREGVKNAAGWWFSPLPQVGSTSCALRCTPHGQDTASSNGCRTQSFTSWSCLSRSYYAGAVLDVDGPAGLVGEEHLGAAGLIYPVREPTSDELQLLSPMERLQLEEGVKVFVGGKGLMTRTQYSVFINKQLQTMEKRLRQTVQKTVVTRAAASGSSGTKDTADAGTQSVPPPPPPPPTDQC